MKGHSDPRPRRSQPLLGETSAAFSPGVTQENGTRLRDPAVRRRSEAFAVGTGPRGARSDRSDRGRDRLSLAPPRRRQCQCPRGHRDGGDGDRLTGGVPLLRSLQALRSPPRPGGARGARGVRAHQPVLLDPPARGGIAARELSALGSGRRPPARRRGLRRYGSHSGPPRSPDPPGGARHPRGRSRRRGGDRRPRRRSRARAPVHPRRPGRCPERPRPERQPRSARRPAPRGRALRRGCLGFSRQARARRDGLLTWFATGSALAALSWVNYLLFPATYVEVVGLGDVLRLLFYLTVLIGVVREVARYQRNLAESAVLAERRRVARELHDGLAQELAFLASYGRLLAKRGADDPDNVQPLIKAAERALSESREVVRDLARPPRESFDNVLAQAARDVADRAGLSLRLELDPRAAPEVVHPSRARSDRSRGREQRRETRRRGSR